MRASVKNILSQIQKFELTLKGGIAIGTIFLWAITAMSIGSEIINLAMKTLIFIIAYGKGIV